MSQLKIFINTSSLRKFWESKLPSYDRGAFAEVRRAIYIEENKPVAIKCIDK